MFMSHDNVQEDLVQWFSQQPKEVFADGICQLVHQSYSCLITRGDFSVAKLSRVSILKQVSVVHDS